MLGAIAKSNERGIAACGDRMGARDMANEDLLGSVHRGTLDEPADWSGWTDKTFMFQEAPDALQATHSRHRTTFA